MSPRSSAAAAPGRRRPAEGHTAVAGEQLELWAVPPATPATSDFVCWLWAAYPQRQGNLNISLVARNLDVSRTTVRRWIASNKPKLSRDQLNTLIRRAILRGHGHFLWPTLDPASRKRSELGLTYALQCHQLITEEPERIAPAWHTNGTLETHTVQLLYFPRAHVYGVSGFRHEKTQAKLQRIGEVVEEIQAPNKYAAIALKQLTLARVDEHRCIAPRALVPTGRTETWLEAAGVPKLRKRLPRST